MKMYAELIGNYKSIRIKSLMDNILKRGIAGSMVFAVFDNDALVNAMLRIWDKIAPPAMFTAAANITMRNTDSFMDHLEMLKWDKFGSDSVTSKYGDSYGWQGGKAIPAAYSEASNDKPTIGDDGLVHGWTQNGSVYTPPGFGTIRGENIVYADTIPPFDITLTFGNEYGQAAFQKIYDVDILNEGSGVSVDTVVMERQMTYIARRISPLIRGVYSREQGGQLLGVSPTSASGYSGGIPPQKSQNGPAW